MADFPGRLGIVQRVLPSYRAPFFDLLTGHCRDGLALFAGQARPREAIQPAQGLEQADWRPAGNLHLFGGPFYLCYQRGLRDWLAAADPDALVVEANPRYLSTPAALRWMQARRRPVLGWGLGAPPIEGALAGWRRARRQSFLAQFDGLIAYSQQGAEQYRRLGFEPVYVVPNAAARRPQGDPPQRPALDGRPTLLFVGRLQARKRLDLLLRACAALPDALQPEIKIVGDGPARDQFQALADEIYPRTRFLGPVYGQDLDTIFHSADLFVLPGTGGLAVQQAMAQALPVIVAEGDGTQADLVVPQNGWLVRPGDAQALQRALEDALSDPAGLRRKGRASFTLVKERFNLESMAEQFIQAVQAVSA